MGYHVVQYFISRAKYRTPDPDKYPLTVLCCQNENQRKGFSFYAKTEKQAINKIRDRYPDRPLRRVSETELWSREFIPFDWCVPPQPRKALPITPEMERILSEYDGRPLVARKMDIDLLQRDASGEGFLSVKAVTKKTVKKPKKRRMRRRRRRATNPGQRCMQ